MRRLTLIAVFDEALIAQPGNLIVRPLLARKSGRSYPNIALRTPSRWLLGQVLLTVSDPSTGAVSGRVFIRWRNQNLSPRSYVAGAARNSLIHKKCSLFPEIIFLVKLRKEFREKSLQRSRFSVKFGISDDRSRCADRRSKAATDWNRAAQIDGTVTGFRAASRLAGR
jgi:hypothetical protein